MLQTAPKENHKELIETFKEDRNRKMADLKLQYDQSIYDMLQRQSVSDHCFSLKGLNPGSFILFVLFVLLDYYKIK